MATLEAEFLSTLGKEALLFRRLQGREELGRLPEYRLELLRPQKSGALDAEKLLGTKVTVKLVRSDKQHRFINAWVVAVEQGGVSGRFDVYRLELRPWLWHLTLNADCRIFQDKTAVEIIEAVFADYSSQQIEKKISGTIRKRNYCVQYRESDFDFVSRLMEEEGIYYYFKHVEGQHTLVLCNSSSGHVAMPDATLGWAPAQADDQLREDVIRQWRTVQSLRTLKYVHTDFDASAPTTKMEAESLRTIGYPKPRVLEVYDYPGGYVDPGLDDTANGTAKAKDEAKRLAGLRVDAFESGHIVASASTPCRSAACGYTFTFADHPSKGDYLITAAHYEIDYSNYEASPDAQADGFSARLEVVPKKTPYQPQPVARRPMIHGPQTATVVGPSGASSSPDRSITITR